MPKRRFRDILSSDTLLSGLAFYIAGYAVFRAALSPAEEGGVVRLVAERPALVALCLLWAQTAGRIVLLLRAGRTAMSARQAAVMLPLFFHAGLLLAVSGLIVSTGTRFDARVVLMEGEGADQGAAQGRIRSVFAGRFSTPPDLAIAMMQIRPLLLDKGRSAWNISAGMLVRTGDGTEDEVDCTSFIPAFRQGTFFSVDEFGYALRRRIAGPEGTVYDEAYVRLHLFPAGTEDSFSVPFSPNDYYVRYYPDRSLLDKSAAAPAKDTKPAYLLRIVRGLDLVQETRLVELGEKVAVEGEIVSFEDMRLWAAVRIVRDPGVFLLMPGLAVALAAAVAGLRRQIPFLGVGRP